MVSIKSSSDCSFYDENGTKRFSVGDIITFHRIDELSIRHIMWDNIVKSCASKSLFSSLYGAHHKSWYETHRRAGLPWIRKIA